MKANKPYRFINWIMFPLVKNMYNIRLEGEKNIPKESSIIVPNHVAHGDPFVMYSQIRSKMDRPVYFVTRDFTEGKMTFPKFISAGGRMTNWYLRMCGNLVLDGGNGYLRQADEILENSHLAVFAEGKINGYDLGIFNDGASVMARRSKKNIVPIYISPYKASKFGSDVTVRVGEPIEHNKGTGNAKALTEKVRGAILGMARDSLRLCT